MHHETWFYPGPPKIPLDEIEQYLETQPLLIPPVLTKTDLVNQPIIRLIWSKAVDTLKQAKRVVFIGYSLPLTDTSAGFLFREGLNHLRSADSVTVVDFAKDEKERESNLPKLMAAYQQVFPDITPDRFCFSGGVKWIRNNMTEWLYDSHGNPIAFRALSQIISRTGRFIGTVRDYFPGRQDVWHGSYRGEIVAGNRFLVVDPVPTGDRGGPTLPLPHVPQIPDAIGPMSLPTGYLDVAIT